VPGAFVGRTAELAVLNRLTTESNGGGPVAALLLGDPGVGKTRLLSEFRSEAGDVRLFATAGYEPEREVPLACMRPFLKELTTVPRFGAVLDDLVFAGDASTQTLESVRLFEAAHQAVAALGPVLVVVDDAQWADRVSLALLHYLVRAARDTAQPMGIVMASRPSTVTETFGESLSRLLEPDRFMLLELGPLDSDDGVRLVRGMAPELADAAAQRIWRAAGGSPFWLEALASGGPAHVDVAALVERRVRSLSDDGMLVLTLLGLVGRPLTVDDLVPLCGAAEAEVRSAIVGLEHRGLVVRAAGSFQVAHDLIRQALLGGLSEFRARQLHKRIADWLEATADADEQPLLEALEHRDAAGLPVHDLAARLARTPRRRLLGPEGLRRLGEIADAAGPYEGSVERDRLLQSDLASLASELGEHEEALRRWSQVAALAQDQVEATRAALRASDSALQLGWHAEAREALERCRSTATDDQVLRAEIAAQEAALFRHAEHDAAAAMTAAERSLAAARKLVPDARGLRTQTQPLQDAYLRALLAVAEGALMVNDPEGLLAAANELARAAVDIDERVHIEALVLGAMALRFLGRNAAAETRMRAAWAHARRRVLPQAMLEVGAAHGRVLLSLGRIADAEAVVDECTALGRRLSELRPAHAFSVILPQLLELLRGDWQRAVDGLGEAADAEREPHYRLQAHMERAWALAWLDPGQASGQVRVAVGCARADAASAGCVRCGAEVALRSVEALARIGDVSEAQALLSQVDVPRADAYNGWRRLGAEAAVVVAGGGLPDAVGALRSVVDEAERQGLLLEALLAKLDLAALLAREQDAAGAAELFRETGTVAEQIGVTTAQRIAERGLRALGVRTWRRGPGTRPLDVLGGLTDREREIAGLVAVGASNREIAGRVFLSRKTVERHVSNILAKYGVRNRAELAALMGDAPDLRER
jgi:DNA-binding NarL/FixJ family response regulator